MPATDRAAARPLRRASALALPPLRPLAIAGLLACAVPTAQAADCTASDEASLGACIAGAVSGGTVTLLNDVAVAGSLPPLPAGVTLRSGGHTLIGAGTLSLGSGSYVSSANANLPNASVRFDGGLVGTLAAATGTTLGLTGHLDVGSEGTAVFGSSSQAGTISLDVTSASVVTNAAFRVAGGTLTGTTVMMGIITSAPASLTIDPGATLQFTRFARVRNLQGAGTLESSVDVDVSSGSFSGTLHGTGSLTKSGAGTLALSGTNGFTGATTVSGGILSVGSAAAAGTGNMMLAGGQLRTTATTAIHNPVLAFSQNAGSTLSAAGGTVLTFSGSTVSIGSGATARFGSATDTGTIVLDNMGAVVDTTGALHVAGGTLRAGTGGVGLLTQAVASTTVDAGATLDFNGDNAQVRNLQGLGTVDTGGVAGRTITVDSGNFGGRITGSGGLTGAVLGNLVLSGDNDYTGQTTVVAGTLQIGAGGTTGTLGTGAVTNTGTLAFNRSGTLVVPNDIGGSGALAQVGPGTTVLTGNNSYSGGTTVAAGTLVVDGSIGGHTNVNAGGTLGGSGSVGSVRVGSGGTLAPGNSIGTLTAGGNLSFAAGSTYRVEANAAGAADRVNTTGAATIAIEGGTVEVRAGGTGYQRNTQYTILRAGGGATGAFDRVTTDLAFLTPTLLYSADSVLLNLQSANAPQYATVAQTSNQLAVANHLQSFADAPSTAAAAALVRQIDNLGAAEARTAFDALAGTPHASASQVAGALGRNFSASLAARGGFGIGGLGNAMNDWSRTHYASVTPASHDPVVSRDVEVVQAGPSRAAGMSRASAAERGFWVQALGAGGDVDSDGASAGLRYRSNGFVLGYDQPVSGRWLAGAAFGYSRSHWDATGGGTTASGQVESPQAGVYAHHAGDAWRLRLDLTFADHRFETERGVTIGAFTGTASSRHHGKEWGLAAQVERPMRVGDWQVKALAGLRFAHLAEDGFSETGAGNTNLAVADRTTKNALLSAGMHFSRTFHQGKGGLELRAVASHLAGDVDTPVTASLAGQSGSFTANGTPLRRNALTLGTTLGGEIARGVSVHLDADYEIRGSGQRAFLATAGVRVGF
jgi:fibronectin-binding autotransporter adhesin